jgi:Zn-dependent protease with chaperone function
MNKALKEFALSAVLFFGIFYATLQVDWMRLLHLSPTIVSDKLTEWTWDLMSSGIREVQTDEIILPIDTLVREMCLANGIDTASITVVVSKTPEVNAYATVGRHLVVNTGIINIMDNEAQLCAVLGHEVAHLQLNHIQTGIRRQAAIFVILTLITGNGRGTDRLNEFITDMIGNSITRTKENEADAQGARYLHAMHLDPLEMGNVLEKLDSYGVFSFLSDHDDSKKRAERIRNMEFSDNGPCRQILSAGTWERLQQLCR